MDIALQREAILGGALGEAEESSMAFPNQSCSGAY